MSDAVVLAIITGLPATIAALAGLRKSNQNGAKADEIKTSIAAGDIKTDALQAKADEIHESTNGNLSKVTEELRLANLRIESLETMVAALVEKVGR